jgi:tRNA threonylcarbamoyl adenosine modification protein YeaZ
VEAVVVGIGPGPYSGLRVGIAFGIGLARAWSVPIVGVCSLDARAWQIARTMNEPAGAEFTIATDARRREHYVARYRIDNANNAIVRVVGPMVSANSLPEAAHRDVEIDPAWLAAHVAGFIDQGCTPQPVEPVLVEHGGDASSFSLEQGPLFTPTPLYLRKPDATIAGSLPV